MIKRFSWAAVTGCLALLLLPLVVSAATINWGISTPVNDETNLAPLAFGDVVQLIWDKDNDGIDLPAGDRLPGGGDELLDSSTIGTGTFFPGTFATNTPATVPYSVGMRIYVRAFNANALADATHCGNSRIFVTDKVEGYTLDATISYTDLSIIPTAVDLAYFSAKSKPDHVLLFWETVSEASITGFNVQRGPTADGPWQKLNPLPIPTATPGSAGGHAYSWIDSTVPHGGTYYYRLDEVRTDGSSNPLEVTWVSYRTENTFWLPLLLR
jgi:hypothetical protein